MRSETKQRTNSKRVLADSHKQEKRKEFYEKKRERKLRKKYNVDSEDELDQEEGRIGDFSRLVDKSKPVFGEQAQAPPKFTVLPKHASKIDLAIAKRVKAAGIEASSPMNAFKEKKKMLVAKLADIDPEYASSIAAPSASAHVDQSEAKRREIESLREKVQEQYRKLKETRIAEKRNSITSIRPIDKTTQRKKRAQNMNFSEEDMERFQAMRPESKASMKQQRRENRKWR